MQCSKCKCEAEWTAINKFGGMCANCYADATHILVHGECDICGQYADRCDDIRPYCECCGNCDQCEDYCTGYLVTRCDGCGHVPSHCQCHVGTTDVAPVDPRNTLAIAIGSGETITSA